MITGRRADSWTPDFPNTKQECSPLGRHILFKSLLELQEGDNFSHNYYWARIRSQIFSRPQPELSNSEQIVWIDWLTRRKQWTLNCRIFITLLYVNHIFFWQELSYTLQNADVQCSFEYAYVQCTCARQFWHICNGDSALRSGRAGWSHIILFLRNKSWYHATERIIHNTVRSEYKYTLALCTQ
jgi:hypothetical protein